VTKLESSLRIATLVLHEQQEPIGDNKGWKPGNPF